MAVRARLAAQRAPWARTAASTTRSTSAPPAPRSRRAAAGTTAHTALPARSARAAAAASGRCSARAAQAQPRRPLPSPRALPWRPPPPPPSRPARAAACLCATQTACLHSLPRRSTGASARPSTRRAGGTSQTWWRTTCARSPTSTARPSRRLSTLTRLGCAISSTTARQQRTASSRGARTTARTPPAAPAAAADMAAACRGQMQRLPVAAGCRSLRWRWRRVASPLRAAGRGTRRPARARRRG